MTQYGYPFIVKRVFRNKPLGQAQEIYRGEKSDVSVRPLLAVDGAGHRINLIQRSLTLFSRRFAILKAAPDHQDGFTLHWLDLPDQVDFKGIFQGRLLFVTRKAWKNPILDLAGGSLISMDPEKPDAGFKTIFAANHERSVVDVSVMKNAFSVLFTEKDSEKMAMFQNIIGDNPEMTEIPFPETEGFYQVSSDTLSDEMFLETEGKRGTSYLWLVGRTATGEMRADMVRPRFLGD